MNDPVRLGVGIIAVAAILGFVFLYGRAIVLGWLTPNTKIEHRNEYVYVATLLAGLVGGVMAMVFNEELPKQPPPTPAAATAVTGESETEPPPSDFGPQAAADALKRSVTISRDDDFLSAMSTIYMLSYLIVGLAAIATWVRLSSNTSDLVKNIALIAIGLFLAIARTFFNISAS